MAYVRPLSWAELSAQGAIPMIVFRKFTYLGEIKIPGQEFSCDNPRLMRQLYEQRLIQPAPAVATALETVRPPHSSGRDQHGRFTKRN
jgi:hypothetical protein